MQVLSIGEILWDVFPEQELLGGAALNFCVNAHRLGDSCNLMTAVGDDRRGQMACEQMRSLGLTTEFVEVVDGAPTGVAMVEMTPDGEPQFTIRRPAAYDKLTLPPGFINRTRSLGIDWLYFGTLMQTNPSIESLTNQLAHLSPSIRCFYDINLRKGQWNFPLVQRLCRLASVFKLNEGEAKTLSELSGRAPEDFSLEVFCPQWASAYDIDVICVTLGGAGCYVYEKGSVHRAPGNSVAVCDTVGSGDAFAAGFLHGYHLGLPMQKIASLANALGALVASRAGATPPWSIEECLTMATINE
jgi:fructokinase